MSRPDERAVEARDHDWIMSEAERLKALGETARRDARDPVSQPIINAWLDAMGETDPRFTEGVAPPAMAQVWTMPGLRGTRGAGDPLSGRLHARKTGIGEGRGCGESSCTRCPEESAPRQHRCPLRSSAAGRYWRGGARGYCISAAEG